MDHSTQPNLSNQALTFDHSKRRSTVNLELCEAQHSWRLWHLTTPIANRLSVWNCVKRSTVGGRVSLSWVSFRRLENDLVFWRSLIDSQISGWPFTMFLAKLIIFPQKRKMRRFSRYSYSNIQIGQRHRGGTLFPQVDRSSTYVSIVRIPLNTL